MFGELPIPAIPGIPRTSRRMGPAISVKYPCIPSPVDISFQKISGLSRTLKTTSINEGGENMRNYHLAGKIEHGSLVLERGVMTPTPLTLQFERQFCGEYPSYLNVIIMLLDNSNVPVTSWFINNALPVSWQSGDLDANSNAILINRLELRYQNMRMMPGIKA
ncbi:phage tail protein [Shewanella psychrophila]